MRAPHGPTGLLAELFERRKQDLDAAVSCAAFAVGIRRDGLVLPATDSDEALAGHLRLFLQITNDMRRARDAQLPVRRVRADSLLARPRIVGVAHDLDVPIVQRR